MRFTRFVAAFCLVLAGCEANTDLTPFAEGTAALATAIRIERDVVLLSYDRSIALAQQLVERESSQSASDDIQRIRAIATRLKSQRAAFTEASAFIVASIHAASRHAQTLAELADSGIRGRGAATLLAESLQEMLPSGERLPDLLIGEQMERAGRQVEAIVGAVAAQDSLIKAVLAAQPAIDVVSESIQRGYSGPWQLLVSSLVSDTDELLVYAVGESAVAYYVAASARRNAVYAVANDYSVARGELRGIGALPGGEGPGRGWTDCAQGKELDALEARLARLFPAMRALEQDRDDLRQWRASRRVSGQRLVSAVAAWASEYGRVASALRDRTPVYAAGLHSVLPRNSARKGG
jgi:hypothetical protein